MEHNQEYSVAAARNGKTGLLLNWLRHMSLV